MNILTKAKSIPYQLRRRPVTEDELTLALAWLKDEISPSQADMALGVVNGRFSCRVGLILKEAYKKGHIKILEKNT